ncbi:MAG TPA: hypothetical protein VKV80_15705 [Streptosporangiaceae bacterium]|nr:hypothetical protein [Streptosporangiaceae bacterium]
MPGTLRDGRGRGAAVTAGGALPVLGYAGMALLCLHEAVFAVRHAVRCRTNKMGHRCTCPLTHRFLAGRAFHGFVVTDATYWSRADSTDGHVSPFQKLPGWQRRALRTGPVLAVLGALVSWPLTLAAASLAAVPAGAAVAARKTACGRRCAARAGRAAGGLPPRLVPARLRERFRRRHGSRMQDMAQALASITGSASVALKPQIDWNPAYASAGPGGHVATWYLPRGFKALAKEKAHAEEVWRGRVGFGLVAEWRTADARPCLVLTRARELPEVVYLRDVAGRLEQLDDSKTAIGLDDQGNLIPWDWGTENPHGVINAGSRHGKTELNKCMIGQICRKGGSVTYIDPKEISIQGMEGVPGLVLYNDPGDIPAMWEGIARFRALMDRRRKERAADPAAAAGWNRQVLFLEEVNQFSEQSDDVWDELPEEDPGTAGTELWKPRRARKTPRVWRHIKAIAWQGAAFKMHLVVDGQDVQATVLKGVRNSLGMRLLGGYLPQQWKYLVGTAPVPPAPPQPGRWCLVNGAEQTWVQAIVGDLDADESSVIWRDYARDGRRMDGTRPLPVTGSFTVTGNGTIHAPVMAGQRAAASAAAAPATDLGTPMSLLEITRTFLLPHGSQEEQKKLAQVLRQDRYRSDKGELPGSLAFPEPAAVAVDGRQTELFIPSSVIEFNQARRGTRT